MPLCERSLRRELDNLNGVGDGVDSTESSAAQKKLALTFIGIGTRSFRVTYLHEVIT